ncbi:MAG: hypothetical protein JW384_03077 [Nitrosomonadaceae bacterium]|nr:hypothetical protein [Nitrosomonadaceae bacterium]
MEELHLLNSDDPVPFGLLARSIMPYPPEAPPEQSVALALPLQFEVICSGDLAAEVFLTQSETPLLFVSEEFSLLPHATIGRRGASFQRAVDEEYTSLELSPKRRENENVAVCLARTVTTPELCEALEGVVLMPAIWQN